MIAQIDQESVEFDELIVVENVKDLCRCCLSNVCLSDIFEVQVEDLPFASIFSELLSTTVDRDDQMPQKLCRNCVDEIVRFYEFKKKFHQSQRLLEILRSTMGNKDYVTLINPQTATIFVKEETNEENGQPIKDDHASGVVKEEVFIEDEKNIFCSGETDFLGDDALVDLKACALPRIFLCEGCGKRFDLIGIRRHTCTVCCVCKKDYRQLRRVKVHMNSHTNSRPYPCEYCTKRFNSSTQLGRHRRIHTGEKPHSCKFCGKQFRVSYSCIDHMRRIHLKTEKPTYLCPVCGRTFDNCNRYAGHVQSHKRKQISHKEQARIRKSRAKKPQPSRTFLCEICSKVYQTQQGLDVHLLGHGERKFHCTICDKKFTNKTILNGHLKTHNVERNCVCQYCGKGFKYDGLLRGHLKIHTGTNYRFKCEVCAKKLPTNHKLQAHMRTHTGEKPFKCSFCGKNFAHSGNLKVHEKAHTEHKFYECHTCKKKFFNVKVLIKHRMTHT